MTEVLQRPALPTVEIEALDPLSLAERAQRLQQNMRIIRFVSKMVSDGQLPVSAIDFMSEDQTDVGVYVSEDLVQPGSQISGLGFSFDIKGTSGRVDSAHAVLTGSLDLATAKSKSGHRTLEVAAKCFDKRARDDRIIRAQRELSIMRELRNRGELALVPVALAIAPEGSPTDGEVVIITRLMPGLQTLDNNPWRRGATRQNMALAIQGVQAVGHFNRLGYKHSDGKVKNVAQREDGRTGMIDYETTTRFDIANPLEASDAAVEDFGKYIDSLKQKGFFERSTYLEKDELILILAEEYLMQWTDATGDVQSAVVSVVDQVVEQFKSSYRRPLPPAQPQRVNN